MGQTVDKRQIRNYTISRIVYQDDFEVIYQANSQTPGKAICLKTFKKSSATMSAQEMLDAEAALLKDLRLSGVPKFIEVFVEGGVHFLAFERPFGLSFSDRIRLRPSVNQTLEVAIAFLSLISDLHKEGWLLLDINFDKIMWSEEKKQVSVLDIFPLIRKAKDGIVAKQIPHNVAYCSPEQTGRSNRPIDERSDVYMAGMALHHLLTGKMAVDPTDVMRAVHFHMAFNVSPLQLENVALSNVLDSVISRMTAKSKDERYQSIDGVLFDLREIYKRLQESKDVSTFTIATRDFSSELVLSQELYGRDRELQTLKSQLLRAERSKLELVFIKGQPGIGKSSLIKEFMSQIDLDRYLFVSGKYRQLEQNEHLKGVVLACEQIIRRKSLSLESEFTEWLARVSESIGDNWSLVASVLPGLKTLQVRKSVEMNLSPSETHSRLIESLYRFIVATATPENPLILFFDDIQWFDQGSKDFLHKLVTEEDSRYILLLCSYRADEVDENHDVGLLIKDLHKSKVSFSEISLSFIENNEITQLVQDSLQPVKGNLPQFVKMIESKTGGNPFFVKQLLYHIFDEGILKRDSEFAWTWDTEAIVALKASSTVIELLESRIGQLPPLIRELLLRVSCFDGWFTRAQLIHWFQYQDAFLNEALSYLESENYIYSDKESNFFIFHDRIREAAYGLLSEEEKKRVHQTIGDNVYEEFKNAKSHEQLVRAVSHLNKGYSADFSTDKRVHLAQINLNVAQYARDVSAFDVALHYATKGLEILSEEFRKKNIELYFSLELIFVECIYLKGWLKEAAVLFKKLEKIRVAAELKAKMYIVYMDLLHAENEFRQVAIVGRKALHLFGVSVPSKISKLGILWNIARLEISLKRLGVENIPNIPKITNRQVFLVQTIWTQIGASAYFYDKELYIYSVLYIFRTVLKFGAHASTASVGVFYSVFMLHRFGKYKSSLKLAMKLEELRIRQDGIPFSDRGNFAFGGFLLPWVQPISVAKQSLEKLFSQMKRLGNPMIANFAALYLVTQKFESGEPLSEVAKESKRFLKEIQKTGDLTIIDCYIPNILARARLQGENPDQIFSGLTQDSSFSQFSKRVVESDVENVKAWYGYQMLIADTLMRDRQNIEKHIELGKKGLEAVPFAFSIAYYHLFSALYWLDDMIENPERKAHLVDVELSRKKILKWKTENPATFDSFWYMFEAAYHTYKKDFDRVTTSYMSCVEASVQSGNLLLNGLANERLGRFLLTQNKNNIAYRCLGSALNSYDQWQASAKVVRLQAEFPTLMVGRRLDDRRIGQKTEAPSNTNLDVLSVVKSCQIIGNEMDFSKLLSQIVFLLIENAGAERGHVFLKTDDQLILRASSTGTRPEDVVILNRKLESVETVSMSLVKYVSRTLETVVIDDAQANELVRNDMYIKMSGCKSILCLPIVNKGQLFGVIWLENNHATEVFSAQRAKVLEILASQAAISFENARLFDQEQEKMRMESELRVAQTVQNTLFEVADGTVSDFRISGSIEPASECGGDWWHYGTFGNLSYFCIGDATGHGVSAALITSAVRSAMATIEYVNDISALQIIKILNNAVARTSKGQINMTMFLGVYDREKNQFSYCNNSHEPTIHVPWAWIEELRSLSKTDRATAIKRFRKELTFLSDVTGSALGSSHSDKFNSIRYELNPQDYLFCYTDGIPEMVDSDERMLGERVFIQMLAEAFLEEKEIANIRGLFREKLRQFRTTAALKDDVTFFLTQKSI